LNNKINEFLNEIEIVYGVRFCDINNVVNYFEYLEFIAVYNKGKLKRQEQKNLKTAREYNQRLNKYDNYLKTMGETRNSMSKTDKDATFMRLKDDYMNKGQLKAAYNIQLAVENEYIVNTLVSSERSDQLTLIPLLDKIASENNQTCKIICADAGYESEENLVYLKKHLQKSYIKPTNYEQQKTKKFKLQIGKKENMVYDKELDQFTCANNKKLKSLYETTRISKSGYESCVTIYECENCSNCCKRELCTKAQETKNRQIQQSKLFQELRVESQYNITSEFGIQLRTNRSIQIEGVFGIIKEDYNFRRLSRRLKSNVENEKALIAIGFNINKLYSHIMNNRLGFTLHEIDSK
jgi:hypothetical protein